MDSVRPSRHRKGDTPAEARTAVSNAPLELTALSELVVERGIDHQLLRRFGRYLTGAPSVRRIPGRVRRLPVPHVPLRRRKLGNGLRCRVPLGRITTPWGFSFHPEGWHPYVATLRCWLAGDPIRDGAGPLHRLYRQFKPRTLQQVLLEHLRDPREPIGSWPARAGLLSVWSLTPRRVRRALATSRGRVRSTRQFIGPAPPEFVDQDIDRLLDLFESVRKHGYAPRRFEAAPVTGYFLVRGTDYRFVCRHGNHRLAVLSVLGHQEVDVALAPGITPVVDHDDLPWWSVDRGGLYPGRVVSELFRKMFHETGRPKARRLGILDRIETPPSPR